MNNNLAKNFINQPALQELYLSTQQEQQILDHILSPILMLSVGTCYQADFFAKVDTIFPIRTVSIYLLLYGVRLTVSVVYNIIYILYIYQYRTTAVVQDFRCQIRSFELVAKVPVFFFEKITGGSRAAARLVTLLSAAAAESTAVSAAA